MVLLNVVCVDAGGKRIMSFVKNEGCENYDCWVDLPASCWSTVQNYSYQIGSYDTISLYRRSLALARQLLEQTRAEIGIQRKLPNRIIR
jgi:hypothetical protein